MLRISLIILHVIVGLMHKYTEWMGQQDCLKALVSSVQLTVLGSICCLFTWSIFCLIVFHLCLVHPHLWLIVFPPPSCQVQLPSSVRLTN